MLRIPRKKCCIFEKRLRNLQLTIVKPTAIQLSEPNSSEDAMQARPILSSPALPWISPHLPTLCRSLLPKAFCDMAIRWNDSLHPDHADGGANRALDLPHLPWCFCGLSIGGPVKFWCPLSWVIRWGTACGVRPVGYIDLWLVPRAETIRPSDMEGQIIACSTTIAKINVSHPPAWCTSQIHLFSLAIAVASKSIARLGATRICYTTFTSIERHLWRKGLDPFFMPFIKAVKPFPGKSE